MLEVHDDVAYAVGRALGRDRGAGGQALIRVQARGRIEEIGLEVGRCNSERGGVDRHHHRQVALAGESKHSHGEILIQLKADLVVLAAIERLRIVGIEGRGLAEIEVNGKRTQAYPVHGIEVEVLVAESHKQVSLADCIRAVGEDRAKILEGNSNIAALLAERDNADRGAGDGELRQLGANRGVNGRRGSLSGIAGAGAADRIQNRGGHGKLTDQLGRSGAIDLPERVEGRRACE